MPRTLGTVDAAVRVLEAFDADRVEWRASALAAHLNQPMSTVHEQLVTLTENGFLMRSARGQYRLGWRLLKLSSALYGSVPWYAPAHDAMNAVARGTHLLAFLCVLQASGNEHQVLCVARSVQGRDGPPVHGETQFVLPPHASASGKLLFALHDLGMPMDAAVFTPFTRQGSWESEAASIREQRLAVTRDEWAVGTSGLAVPLLDADGQVLAALGVSLPTPRFREQEQLTRRLQDAAAEVAWALGHRPTSRQSTPTKRS